MGMQMYLWLNIKSHRKLQASMNGNGHGEEEVVWLGLGVRVLTFFNKKTKRKLK